MSQSNPVSENAEIEHDVMDCCRYLPSQPQTPWIHSEMKSSLNCVSSI